MSCVNCNVTSDVGFVSGASMWVNDVGDAEEYRDEQ